MPLSYKTEQDAVRDLEKIQGAPFVAYRQAWDRVNQFELETDFPLFLHIEPSYKCNLRCPMCTQGIPELKAKFGYDEQLNTEQILRILGEAKEYGCPSISFQGDNEPFLIKEMPQWFRLAREAGFQDIMVNTNGTAMTEAIARETIPSGLTRIRFSLDAIRPETYAQIRIGAKYDRVHANILNFLKIREELGSVLPKVGVNFVRMAMNEGELEEFVNYWNSKVDYVVVQEFMTPDSEGDFKHLEGKTKKAVNQFRCNQPWQRLYIRGNGDVTPCCAMFSSYLKIGNIMDSSLKELWESQPAKKLRRLHAEGRYHENAVCLKCSKNGIA